MSFDKHVSPAMAGPSLNPYSSRHGNVRNFTAAEIDRLADHELAVGHIHRAEMLAWQAAALREARS